MRYYIFATSMEFFEMGFRDSVICTKQRSRMERLQKGDFVVLYASKMSYKSKKSCHKFVGLSKVIDEEFEAMEVTPEIKDKMKEE